MPVQKERKVGVVFSAAVQECIQFFKETLVRIDVPPFTTGLAMTGMVRGNHRVTILIEYLSNMTVPAAVFTQTVYEHNNASHRLIRSPFNPIVGNPVVTFPIKFENGHGILRNQYATLIVYTDDPIPASRMMVKSFQCVLVIFHPEVIPNGRSEN
jgi:hypothetical protein